MKTLTIKDKQFLLDDEDFGLVSQYTWRLFDNGRGHIYAQWSVYLGRVDGKKRYVTIRLHRSLLGLTAGDIRMADHINGNTLDNRRANLRIASARENSVNRRLKRGGAQKSGDGFVARVCRDGNDEYIGFYKTAEAAAEAYQEAAGLIHEGFHRQFTSGPNP